MPTPNQVERLRAKLAEPHGNPPGVLTMEDREAIVADYLDGMTQAAIARKYGVTHQTITYHLQKFAR